VSNDGSANAWAYPLAEVSRAPSPSEGIQVVDAAKMDEAADGEGRDEDERKSRASTPREGTPVEEEGKATSDENTKEASTTEPAGDDPSQLTETSATQADTTDVEMTDVSNTVGVVPAEEGTETDIEMPVASGSQAVKSGTIASPPSRSSAPSRVPTPPPATASTTLKAKVTPLKCLRHTICHSASLLSLSFDPSGKCVWSTIVFSSADLQIHGDRWSRCHAESFRYSGLDMSADLRHVHVSRCSDGHQCNC